MGDRLANLLGHADPDDPWAEARDISDAMGTTVDELLDLVWGSDYRFAMEYCAISEAWWVRMAP